MFLPTNERDYWLDQSDTLANEQDACREYAANCGSDRAWVLTPFDTWEPNPHYRGPRVPHPESYEAQYDDDMEF